ncbi:hypothetical protein BV98_002205 [Sphingobium herbicidovorans NBRC 16415]|uniref:Uncharacterized protein n=1 Tax=Sphingobium herbicidovorans (strain ATCC 700291 / DSM 11019 / CCUG 56400 / KCTC 2939 / LMG 18315 / NBRC 16415 / MH) TaxID=1219045 RepID=A0A086P9G4_SPHHM|nr:hypothetical protein [Sphingobium herbicidovorans]KFG90032.1 hypothetical protein BV98_002205 [Sphingobium herbicidovorans NBRC 16415]
MNYGQIEALYASLHRIRPEKRVAFKARLKHLQRLGFPPGVNTGTGRAAVYGPGQIFLLGLALEFTQMGINPDRTVKIIQDEHWLIVKSGEVAARDLSSAAEPFKPIMIFFDPAALSDLMEAFGDGIDTALATLDFGKFDSAQEAFASWFSEGASRAAFISISSLLRRIEEWLLSQSSSVPGSFYADLITWAEHQLKQAAP